MAKNIKLVKSLIGRKKDQIATAQSLGLRKVGEMIAKNAADKGISEVVFDRGGYLYHGRVKSLADSARENGLKF